MRVARRLSESSKAEAEVRAPQKPRKPRRGVTALEYLVMLSLIIVVVILTVQHLGKITGGMMGKNADATAKTVSGTNP